MTNAVAAVPVAGHGRSRASARSAFPAMVTDAVIAFALILLFLLGHSFVGIDHDARIYMGRAMADLDPNGVGRDMLFANDGQSSFTIFRPVARILVAYFGLAPTVVLLTVVNLIVWFGAITVFVRTIAPGRVAALVLAITFVLPHYYSPWHLLGAGESVPVPRPLAEAGVLFAMAALCRGRTWLAVACLLAAALFHPIMAAPGFAVLLLVVGMRDWRVLAGAVLVGCGVLGAAALGMPVASRLWIHVDPTWAALLRERNSYLFVTTWSPQVFGMLAVQAMTIVLACFGLQGQPRLVMVSAMLTGILGAAASALFCDGLASLLVVQAQFWRALWLPAALAPVAAGLCVLHFGGRGREGAIVLALLLLAWTCMEVFPVGPLAAGAALAVHLAGRFRTLAFSRLLVVLVWIACLALAVTTQVQSLIALLIIVRQMPLGAMMPWQSIWTLGFAMMPVTFIAYACWRRPDSGWVRSIVALLIGAAVVLVATQWDSRRLARADADTGHRKGDLLAMIASRPGEVLWINSDLIWSWLGRGNWNSLTQGGAIVFSRDLAVKWQDRAHLLRVHRLATDRLLEPWNENLAIEPVDIFAADLAGFCRESHAPAWIIAPVARNQAVPVQPGVRIWASGVPDSKLLTNAEGFRWTIDERYAVIECARM